MTRKLLWLGLILSLGANVVLLLMLVDAGIVVDNAQSQSELLRERRDLALEIIGRDWVGRPVGEVDDLARGLEERGVPVGLDGEHREIGDFIFHVEQGVVTGVRDLDSPDPERAAHP